MTNKAYVTLGGVSASIPPLASLSDSFSGSSLSSDWTPLTFVGLSSTTPGTEISEGGGQLSISPLSGASNQGNVFSSGAFNFADSSAQVELVELPSSTDSTQQMLFGVQVEPGLSQYHEASLYHLVTAGSLYMVWENPPSAVNVAIITFDPVAHKWLRIREASGTCYWDTSPDGATWTNQASAADPFDLTSVHAMLVGNQVGGGGTFTVGFADFNVGSGFPVSYSPGSVGAEAVVLASDDTLVSAFSVAAPFDYGDSNESIREAVETAVQTAAGDASLSVEFVTG